MIVQTQTEKISQRLSQERGSVKKRICMCWLCFANRGMLSRMATKKAPKKKATKKKG
jgi:hypothetical protein